MPSILFFWFSLLKTAVYKKSRKALPNNTLLIYVLPIYFYNLRWCLFAGYGSCIFTGRWELETYISILNKTSFIYILKKNEFFFNSLGSALTCNNILGQFEFEHRWWPIPSRCVWTRKPHRKEFKASSPWDSASDVGDIALSFSWLMWMCIISIFVTASRWLRFVLLRFGRM